MNVLAIETSTPTGILAARDSGGLAHESRTDPSIRHGRALVPAIRDLLDACGLRPRDLDAVTVGLGPGSFTGLRIGLTAAKTLAYATGCRLVGLDSLTILARNAPGRARRVIVLVDAQRGELFAAEFARDGEGEPLSRTGPTRIVPAASLAEMLTPGSAAVGPALDRPSFVLPEGAIRCPAEHNHPDGPALLAEAMEAIAAGRRDDPWFLEPIYIRRSAAEEKRDAAGRAAGGS